MNFCLSDLVPPLRWSDAATIPLLRDQPDLPDAWWRSLPVARVLAVLGPERLAEVLTTIALEHWPAAAVGDVLPALHVLDPEDADEPCTAIALDRAGSWPGLLALTGHDLRDQPFIQPVPLLHTLFAAVLTRLATSVPAGTTGTGARGSVAPSPAIPSSAVPAGPVLADPLPGAPVLADPPQPVPVRPDRVRPVASVPDSRTAPEEPKVQAAPPPPAVEETEAPPEVARIAGTPEPSVTPVRDRAADDAPSRDFRSDEAPARDSRDRDAEEDAAPGSLFRPAAARRSRSEIVPPVGASLPAEPPAADGTGGTGHEAEPEYEAGHEAGPEADHEAGAESRRGTEHGTAPEAVPEADGRSGTAPEAEDGSRAGSEAGEDAPEDRLRAEPELEPGAGLDSGLDSGSGDAPHPAGALPEPEAVPEPVADAGTGHADTDGGDGDGDGDGDGENEPVAGEASGRPATNLHALVDGVFANVEDKRWAVAQNRLFSDVPATVEALAKLFAVQPDVIRGLEADLRRELAEWVASDEAAPYREHLEAVKDVLGKAAPRERLVNAAEWHTLELRSLDVPAWQFVLACLPEYHLVDEWLVEGDIAELRHRTRDMISGAKPPLTIHKALDMVSSLGIHPEVSQEWLENVPQLRILGVGERPPQRAGGAPALTVEKPGDGTGGAGGAEPGGEPAKAPFRPLKDVSLTRRCFRQPDGRWWLRIDVTDDHLRGTECPLPSGFAAYLGMAPGTGRRVSSAVGELALNWQDRPVLESLGTLLADVGAKEGSHLFLTLSDEGVLRARHLPAAGDEVETTARALRLVGYTAAGGTPEQAVRVIATRVGMSGPANLPDLLARLRERGDRDLLSLLG